MIGCVALKGPIFLEGENFFAFYDTVEDKFCEFSGAQIWESEAVFLEEYDGDDPDQFTKQIPEQFKPKRVEG